tara:strand:+ start:26226 stop:28460 length:2235 start_codon:yes stop_codon:yes gene_type:complete
MSFCLLLAQGYRALKDVLLITPPFTQLNTPYPATAYLKGFLRTKGIDVFQMDLGIEVILKLFSSSGLDALFDVAIDEGNITSENSERIVLLREEYVRTIDSVMRFLQGKQHTLARQICSGGFLPQAQRFNDIEETEWAFGMMGMQDQARYMATLYLGDLSDFIIECIDEHFGFSRYAERLGRSANSFDELHEHLQQECGYIDRIALDLLRVQMERWTPKLVCLSVPFPGNLFGAFRCAQWIKAHFPDSQIAMGGGFPNTELRSLKEPRVFDYVDFVTLDDGELPLELLLSYISNPSADERVFKRTFLREDGEVLYENTSTRSDYNQSDVGTPDYSDLLLDQYISVIQMPNPMHSLWSDGRWNKLTMAHGCYWGKCTFCDVSLDYIKRYEPVRAKLLVDRMEELIEQTGETGFHFVDEAAPPALMRDVALEILRRQLVVTWWTNVRFEKTFTKALCLLLKASGCVAVSGGLEVASNRLLKLINKGISVEQVALVTRNLTEAGIMVHAYLMYGYPTQTEQETIDSLEMTRQLFALGILQSGFWHQFALTAHSPIGLDPDAFGVIPQRAEITFADNDVMFEDSTGIDHDKFSQGLKTSLYNYMHGVGFDLPLSSWFDFRVPRTQVKQHFIESCLAAEGLPAMKSGARVLWLGAPPMLIHYTTMKKGVECEMVQLIIHDKTRSFGLDFERTLGEWFADLLERCAVTASRPCFFGRVRDEYEEQFEDFEGFWYARSIMGLRDAGVLLVF